MSDVCDSLAVINNQSGSAALIAAGRKVEDALAARGPQSVADEEMICLNAALKMKKLWKLQGLADLIVALTAESRCFSSSQIREIASTFEANCHHRVSELAACAAGDFVARSMTPEDALLIFCKPISAGSFREFARNGLWVLSRSSNNNERVRHQAKVALAAMEALN